MTNFKLELQMGAGVDEVACGSIVGCVGTATNSSNAAVGGLAGAGVV